VGVPSTPDPQTTANELHVITDTVDRQRARVASLAEPYLGTDRDDIVTTIHEAERQLLMAVRALRRAVRTVE